MNPAYPNESAADNSASGLDPDRLFNSRLAELSFYLLVMLAIGVAVVWGVVALGDRALHLVRAWRLIRPGLK